MKISSCTVHRDVGYMRRIVLTSRHARLVVYRVVRRVAVGMELWLTTVVPRPSARDVKLGGVRGEEVHGVTLLDQLLDGGCESLPYYRA